VENTWSRFSADASYEYIAPFSNDGEYYVLKPFKKDYFIVSYCGGKLFRGKKKYKSIEAAHAGWPKEQQYIFNMHESKPDKCAQNKD
jgi:peptide methionine sulfoxide reductase MsrB